TGFCETARAELKVMARRSLFMMETFGPSPSCLDAGLSRGLETMIPPRFLSILLVLVLAGCGEIQTATNSRSFRPEATAGAARTDLAPMMKALGPSNAAGSADATKALGQDRAVAMLVAAQPGPAAIGSGPSEISRKIIYDGQVDLVVESVD